MRTAGIAIVLASLALPALAQDVPWFDAHPADRKAQLEACRRDRHIGMLPVCDNAQTSETNDFIRRRRASEGLSGGGSTTPRPRDVPWFDAHPTERQAQLDACRRDRDTGSVCDNAKTSEGLAARRRQAGTGPMPGVNLPWEPSPLLRETIKRQCAQPREYRLFPDACGS